MKRMLTVVALALVLAAIIVATAMPAFAVNEGPGRGNPDTAPGSGKCPPGQNQETSPGGLKKCP